MTGRVSFDFTGTTVLITGGTSGIGHATASLFRDAGAQVTITGTKPLAPDYEVDLDGVHQYSGNPSMTGLGKLPVTFTPGASRGTLRPA